MSRKCESRRGEEGTEDEGEERRGGDRRGEGKRGEAKIMALTLLTPGSWEVTLEKLGTLAPQVS